MALKGLVVTAKSVKGRTSGIVDYMNYLNSSNHKNHKNKQTKIIPFLPNKNDEWANQFIHTVSSEALEVDLKNSRGKGGRPIGSYAVSFDFTIPKGTVRPTAEQWRAIGMDVLKLLKKEIPALKMNHIFMNIHDQNNPHLNLVVSKVINGKRERKIDQKALLSKLKSVYSNSVLKHTNFNYKDYEPLEENLGKRKEAWQINQEQIKKLFNQFEMLAKYIGEKNESRINSTENRIVKTISNINYGDAEKFLNTLNDTKDNDFNEIINRIKTRIKNK